MNSVADVAASIQDAAHDLATAVVPQDEVPLTLIEQPTSPDMWFTPEAGWPKSPELAPDNLAKWQKHMPPNLIPTADELPQHFEKEPIGELNIEVLQCESLPWPIQLGRVDPYVCILFERNAGRTCTIWNHQNPKWNPLTTQRAFKFPITCSYSSIHLSVNDDDRGIDDGLGRVVIELNSLRVRTVYDCWFALQYGTLKKHVSDRGTLRIRFSINFVNDQARLLNYLKPLPNFVVPFVDERTRNDSSFAYRGRYPGYHFNWKVFNSHINELKKHGSSVADVAEDFLFWKMPFLSAFICVMFQVLVSYPFLLIACIPLSIAACMVRSYVGIVVTESKKRRPILQKPSIWQLNKQLLLGRQESEVPPEAAQPLLADELDDDEVMSDGDSDTDDDSAQETRKKKKKKKEGPHESNAIDAVNAVAMGVTKGAQHTYVGNVATQFFIHKRTTWDEEVEKLKEQVAEHIEKERQGVMQKQGRAPGTGRGADASHQAEFSLSSLNPLAPILLPIQLKMSEALLVIRTVRRLMMWTDRFESLQLMVVLLLTSCLCAGLGYVIYLIPWSLLLKWIIRSAQ